MASNTTSLIRNLDREVLAADIVDTEVPREINKSLAIIGANTTAQELNAEAKVAEYLGPRMVGHIQAKALKLEVLSVDNAEAMSKILMDETVKPEVRLYASQCLSKAVSAATEVMTMQLKAGEVAAQKRQNVRRKSKAPQLDIPGESLAGQTHIEQMNVVIQGDNKPNDAPEPKCVTVEEVK